MRVRLVQQLSGTRGDGSSWPPAGTELEVPDGEARNLVASGIAVPVAEERAVETADAPPDLKVEERQAVVTGESLAAAEAPTVSAAVPDGEPRRGPGRPPGSKNKPRDNGD